ncbi:hypothetical protein LWC34_42445 [Kibdelosporangium philippinense]|uniref:CU044_5270 family protein n=1 Tax=Kibdelosporangium philippinense TaxID=211113 RepID=A0ABS8ZS50_9PSEU|nr:hypothetical protein [Kibdelosporangium philippinense]MCE7009431.1 hypothetical protein [Kibdelosporangium philippinense]
MPEDDDRALDDALAALYADVQVDPAVQTRVRAELMQAAAETPPRRSRRPLIIAAVAAAVAVVTVGAVLVVTSQPTEISPAQPDSTMPRPPATSDSQHAPMPPMPDEPQNNLHLLAAKVTATPGQYRYATNRWFKRIDTQASSGTTYSYIAEAITETWIPADHQQEWLRRTRTTDNRQWISGTEQQARADGIPLDMPIIEPDGEVRAPCGDFVAGMTNEPCAGRPTDVLQLASGPVKAPADPRKLYEMVAEMSATHADPPLQFFRIASGLFNDTMFTVPTRRALMQMMSRHPYVTLEDSITRDNRKAISVGIAYGENLEVREEVLLDPANGELIGRRTRYFKDSPWSKAGDIVEEETQHTAVVGRLGGTP